MAEEKLPDIIPLGGSNPIADEFETVFDPASGRTVVRRRSSRAGGAAGQGKQIVGKLDAIAQGVVRDWQGETKADLAGDFAKAFSLKQSLEQLAPLTPDEEKELGSLKSTPPRVTYPSGPYMAPFNQGDLSLQRRTELERRKNAPSMIAQVDMDLQRLATEIQEVQAILDRNQGVTAGAKKFNEADGFWAKTKAFARSPLDVSATKAAESAYTGAKISALAAGVTAGTIASGGTLALGSGLGLATSGAMTANEGYDQTLLEELIKIDPSIVNDPKGFLEAYKKNPVDYRKAYDEAKSTALKSGLAQGAAETATAGLLKFIPTAKTAIGRAIADYAGEHAEEVSSLFGERAVQGQLPTGGELADTLFSTAAGTAAQKAVTSAGGYAIDKSGIKGAISEAMRPRLQVDLDTLIPLGQPGQEAQGAQPTAAPGIAPLQVTPGSIVPFEQGGQQAATPTNPTAQTELPDVIPLPATPTATAASASDQGLPTTPQAAQPQGQAQPQQTPAGLSPLSPIAQQAFPVGQPPRAPQAPQLTPTPAPAAQVPSPLAPQAAGAQGPRGGQGPQGPNPLAPQVAQTQAPQAQQAAGAQAPADVGSLFTPPAPAATTQPTAQAQTGAPAGLPQPGAQIPQAGALPAPGAQAGAPMPGVQPQGQTPQGRQRGISLAPPQPTTAAAPTAAPRNLTPQEQTAWANLERKAAELDRRREARRQQQGRNTNPDTRNRGPEQIAMRLINELRSGGTLTLQEANGALRIVEKLMENGYLDNLAVSVSNAQRGAGVRGDYNPVKELVQLFVRNTNRPGVFKRTFAHEVSHHLERMVPAKDLEAARQQFLRERAKWLSDKKGIRALLGEGNWLDRSFTNEQIRDFLAKNQMDPALISKYFIRDTNTGRWRIKLTDETYRYTNFSEYFAEKVAQIAGDRDDNRANNQANPGVWAKVRGMLAQIKKAMIEVFGRDEVEAIWDKFQQGEYSAEFQRDELQGYDKTGGQNPVQDNLTTADYRTPRVGPADAGRQGRVENIDKLEPNRALSARDESTNIPAEREQEAMSIAASIFSGNTEALASADPELVARVKELVQEGKDRAAIKYKQGARVKSDTKWRIGKRLSEENASRGMGVLDMKTVEGRIAMASAIAAEVEHHQSEGKTDINKDWYAESVARTKRIANKLLNGALDDPGNETAFLLIFSLTSNGQTIEANTEIGTHLTRKFLETGKFSNDFVGGGARRPQIIAALQLADRVFNALGKDKAKMREFLNTKFNPDDVYAELEKLGFTSTPQGKKRWWNWKLTVAREVGSAYGSAIFGPKLGGEFYQNMRGNKDATTKDTWFSRAFYRIKGDLTAVNSDTIVKNIERLIAGAQAEGYAIPKAVLADATRTMKAIRSGKFDPNSPVNPEGPLMRFASERLKAYTKSVDPVTKKGFADKTEVNLASKSIVENSRSFKEAPDAGDRSVMDDVSAMAREMLKAKGIDIASDALQAEWWGSEKALYDHLGQDGALNQNETFDLAMEKLYRDTTGNEYQDDAGPAGKGPQRAVARDGGSAGQGIAKPDAKWSRGTREGSGEGVAQSARDDGENTPIPGGYREAFFQAKKGAGAPAPKQIRWWTEVGHDTSGDISNQFLWAIDAKGEMKIISVEDLHEMLGGTPFDSEDSNGQTPSHLDWADDERSEPGLLKGPAHGRIDATGDVVRISMVQKGQNDAAMKADMRDYVKGKLSEIMGVEPNQARGYDFTDASPFKDPEVFSARDEEGPSIPKPSRAGSFKAFDEMVTGREIPKPEGMPYPYNLKRFTTLAPASQTARKNLAGYHLVQQGSDLGPQGKDEAREFRVVSKELMPVSDSPVHEYRIRFRFEPRGPGSAAGAVTVLFTDEGGMNNSTPEHVKIGLISELFERARQAGITDIFVSRDYAGEIDEKELGLFGHVAKTEPEISFGRYSDEDGYNGYKIDKKTAYSARDEDVQDDAFKPLAVDQKSEPGKVSIPASMGFRFGAMALGDQGRPGTIRYFHMNGTTSPETMLALKDAGSNKEKAEILSKLPHADIRISPDGKYAEVEWIQVPEGNEKLGIGSDFARRVMFDLRNRNVDEISFRAINPGSMKILLRGLRNSTAGKPEDFRVTSLEDARDLMDSEDTPYAYDVVISRVGPDSGEGYAIDTALDLALTNGRGSEDIKQRLSMANNPGENYFPGRKGAVPSDRGEAPTWLSKGAPNVRQLPGQEGENYFGHAKMKPGYKIGRDGKVIRSSDDAPDWVDIGHDFRQVDDSDGKSYEGDGNLWVMNWQGKFSFKDIHYSDDTHASIWGDGEDVDTSRFPERGRVDYPVFNDAGQLIARGRISSTKPWSHPEGGKPDPQTIAMIKARLAKQYNARNGDGPRVDASDFDVYFYGNNTDYRVANNLSSEDHGPGVYSARDEEPDARKFVPVEKLFNEEPATAESLYSPTAKKNLPAGATMEFGPLNEPYGADRSYGEWENGVKEKGASAHKIYVRDSEGNVIAEANVIADTSHVFTKRPKYLDGKIQRKAPKLEEGWAMTVEMIAGDSARAQVAIAAEAVERAKMAGATMVIVPFKGWDHREAVGQLIAKLEDTEEVKIDDEIDALNVVFKQNTPDYASEEDGDAAYGIRRDQVYSARDESTNEGDRNDAIQISKSGLISDSEGKPIELYRGQYGRGVGRAIQTKSGSITFSNEIEDARVYAKEPNDFDDNAEEPKILRANLTIRNPWINSEFDHSITFNDILRGVGGDRTKAMHFMRKHADTFENSSLWEEEINPDGKYKSAKDFFTKHPDRINELLGMAFVLLDDPMFVEQLKINDFDGAIHGAFGSGVGTEFKVFDADQVSLVGDEVASRRDEDTPVASSRAGRPGLVAGAMALAPTTVQAATGAAKAGATIAGVAAGDLIGLATGIALTSTDRPLRGLNPIAANMHLLANDTKSPTMARIANMFGLLGGNTSAGAQETYHDSRDSSRRIFRNKLAAAFDPLAKLSQDQIRALDVTIARALAGEIPMPSGAVGQVVQNLRALSDELYNHLREAGVDVNYAQDYAIPHSFNAEAVAKDEQAFIDKAEQAYIRNNPERIRTLTGYIAQIAAEAKANGWTSEMRDRSAALQAEIDKLRNANPRQQAEDLAAAILSGEEGGDQSQGLILGSNPQNQNKADFLKSRVFESAARAMLREYFHNDARHAWNNYIARATTISEFTRRFGKDGEKWNKLVEQLRAEKVSNEDITRIKELVLDAMGALTPAARGGHAMANALLGLSNMSKLKSTFLTNFLEAQAQAIPGGLFDTVTAPVVMLKEFAAVLAELSPRQRALLKRLIRIDLNTETGNMELARIVGLMDASGVHQIMENSAYNLDRSSDFREDSRTDRAARGVSNVTSGLARAYGIEASENAKRAMGARYASGRLDQYVSELIRDNIIARALAKVGYTKDTFTTKNEARMRLRRAGVADADMAAFTQWWEKARASGKFNEMLADSTDPMAAKARRAIRMESSRAMVNSNRAMKPGGERNKAISQDNFWGKAVMSFLNYPAAFREQVAKPMARDIRSGVRGFESEGGESTFFSPAERARMIAKVAAIPAMAVSAAAFLALRTMVNGDDEDKEELQKKGLFSQLIDGLSYTGFLGGKTEAVQRARRGQLPPIVDEGVRLGKNLERESTKSNGKERAVTKSVTRSIGVPALQVAATTALPMPLATVIDQALASKAFTETVVDIVAGPGKAKSTGGSSGSGRESGRESGRSGSRSDGR